MPSSSDVVVYKAEKTVKLKEHTEDDPAKAIETFRSYRAYEIGHKITDMDEGGEASARKS